MNWQSRWFFALGLAGTGVILGCSYDPDERCGPRQVYADPNACICEPGYVFDDSGSDCVRCGEHERENGGVCVCQDGYARSRAGAACEQVSAELGAACDDEQPCAGDEFDYCQMSEGSEGYCTSAGCADSNDCKAGYACNTQADPSYCQRPPVGLGQSCESSADCADTEATYCETLTSNTCLVEGCETADDCFPGNECCDLSSFLGTSLCLPADVSAEFCP